MTNRSRKYFEHKTKFSVKNLRRVFGALFNQMPLPGSADVSRLKMLADLETPNVNIIFDDLNGIYKWTVPSDIKYPVITEVPKV